MIREFPPQILPFYQFAPNRTPAPRPLRAHHRRQIKPGGAVKIQDSPVAPGDATSSRYAVWVCCRITAWKNAVILLLRQRLRNETRFPVPCVEIVRLLSADMSLGPRTAACSSRLPHKNVPRISTSPLAINPPFPLSLTLSLSLSLIHAQTLSHMRARKLKSNST